MVIDEVAGEARGVAAVAERFEDQLSVGLAGVRMRSFDRSGGYAGVVGAGADSVWRRRLAGAGWASSPGWGSGTSSGSGLGAGPLCPALLRPDLLPNGFRNRGLRKAVAPLRGLSLEEYYPGRMTYDLRRLRLRGPERIPDIQRYQLTAERLCIALPTTARRRASWARCCRPRSMGHPPRGCMKPSRRTIARSVTFWEGQRCPRDQEEQNSRLTVRPKLDSSVKLFLVQGVRLHLKGGRNHPRDLASTGQFEQKRLHSPSAVSRYRWLWGIRSISPRSRSRRRS